MKKHLLLLALVLFSSTLWSQHEENYQRHQAGGFNYQYYILGEGYGVGFQTVGLRYFRFGGAKPYVRPTAGIGLGTYFEYDEEGKVYQSPFTQISAGCILGVNKKYAGLKLSNEIGALRIDEFKETSFLTIHKITLNSGHLLKRVELSVNLPLYVTTVNGLPGIGLLEMGVFYKF